MVIQLEPADIFFTRGHGLPALMIRFFTRGFGESRTRVNHVGITVTSGPLDEVFVVEALSKVRRHRLVDEYGDGRSDVAVYRPLGLTPEERQTVVAKAEDYVDRRYGIFKLLFHLLDWLLLGAYLFRRLGRDRYPICSWVVAHAFAKVGRTFGKVAAAADPDDIWDYVNRRDDQFECIRELSPIGARS